jgi:hypothetical protein
MLGTTVECVSTTRACERLGFLPVTAYRRNSLDGGRL